MLESLLNFKHFVCNESDESLESVFWRKNLNYRIKILPKIASEVKHFIFNMLPYIFSFVVFLVHAQKLDDGFVETLYNLFILLNFYFHSLGL